MGSPMFSGGFRKNITLIMLLAFFLNAVIPSLALAVSNLAGPSDGAEKSKIESLVGERFIICTPNGIKWVTWAELESSPSEPEASSAPQCTLCVLPTFGTTVGDVQLLGISLPGLIQAQTRHVFPIAKDARTDVFRLRGAYCRAPPYSL